MVSSSKVLTVSYGTFSCTIEGFDQPMQALEQATSLFHGIVQQDRFFGAFPPKLSQEQIADLFERQILAHQTETGLILSPAPDTAEEDGQNRSNDEQTDLQDTTTNGRFADVIQAATEDETAQDRARDIARLMDAKAEKARKANPGEFTQPLDLGHEMLSVDENSADDTTFPPVGMPIEKAEPEASDHTETFDTASDAGRAARAMLTESTIQDGDESRLMEATDSQFDEPEGNARRNAIAHLRAAVAATRADRQMHRKRGDDGQEPYRDDLANVVRPRRPNASRAETAATSATTPLALRAEQRVDDIPDPVEDTFATSGRIARPIFETASADQAQGFVDYADSMQAQSLSDLLEAAASYLCLVQGKESFSRPQLMNTISQAEVHNSSREDRMRNFAALLREEKIQRTPTGSFTVTDKTGFRTARAAG